MTLKRTRLVIPIGDPAGIGFEVVLKALADPTTTEGAEVTIVGSRSQLQRAYDQLRLRYPTLANLNRLNILDLPLEPSLEAQIVVGEGNAASGAASFRYLETAIAQTLAGKFDGIVTAPIAKSAWKAAGHDYPGQTELLAERAKSKRFGMLFVARSPHTGWTLRTLLATTHIPLRQVADTLTPDLLTLKLELLIESLQHDFGIEQPKIAIAGLNPHSGEQGQLGREEQDWMVSWLSRMRCQFPKAQLDGLIPPDTLWVKPGQSWYGRQPRAAHDGYLALYHDQGLIPVKLMAFDRAVNTSIGLPFVRTSPDHGTAFDIAGRGIADPTSFQAAIQLAIELGRRKSTLS
ncbi:MAG: 4-hydroxythreonine-4-phosphate dehydrogenase PdxA [Leptolyngbyaceae cyanobacterium CSU_1_3]|nr:4-hydroxythreonine-4-phosphate dehydrogenase PdxA [Leptolyngbyaceae cyanobacterium CSU_1_3]